MESSLRGIETMKVGSNTRTARKMSKSVYTQSRVQTLREREGIATRRKTMKHTMSAPKKLRTNGDEYGKRDVNEE
jgi:hypothetical protein